MYYGDVDQSLPNNEGFGNVFPKNQFFVLRYTAEAGITGGFDITDTTSKALTAKFINWLSTTLNLKSRATPEPTVSQTISTSTSTSAEAEPQWGWAKSTPSASTSTSTEAEQSQWGWAPSKHFKQDVSNYPGEPAGKGSWSIPSKPTEQQPITPSSPWSTKPPLPLVQKPIVAPTVAPVTKPAAPAISQKYLNMPPETLKSLWLNLTKAREKSPIWKDKDAIELGLQFNNIPYEPIN